MIVKSMTERVFAVTKMFSDQQHSVPVIKCPLRKSYRLILASADPTKISWSETSMDVTLSLDSSRT